MPSKNHKEFNYTQETREQILKSAINTSTSKQAFSFSKGKRFLMKGPNCPYVSYSKNMSSYKKGNSGFGSSKRKVFTQSREFPSSWEYHPQKMGVSKAIELSKGREDIKANSYISRQLVKNPGPGTYQTPKEQKIAYTMRPKTANSRNYFTDDKEQAFKPSPVAYQDETSHLGGKNNVSKFKTSLLGVSGMMSTSNRFRINTEQTPSSWNYSGSIINKRNKTGGKFGTEHRYAFTDKAANQSTTPGPGNYKLPTDFAHYSKVNQYI